VSVGEGAAATCVGEIGEWAELGGFGYLFGATICGLLAVATRHGLVGKQTEVYSTSGGGLVVDRVVC